MSTRRCATSTRREDVRALQGLVRQSVRERQAQAGRKSPQIERQDDQIFSTKPARRAHTTWGNLTARATRLEFPVSGRWTGNDFSCAALERPHG